MGTNQKFITINRRIRPEEFRLFLCAILGDNTSDKSLIDLCCFNAPITRSLNFNSRCFVDMQDRLDPIVLEDSANEFHQLDVLSDDNIFNKKYNVATAIDAIEHLSKENGYRLIKKMENISDTQIFFTPLGEMWVNKKHNDCPDTHKSGWTPEDVPDYNYIVFDRFHKDHGAFMFWKTNNPDSYFNAVKDRIDKIC